jgi:putative component of toxin-antitoxin plasmid stabilization module
MTNTVPKTTLREFRDYLAVTYEANHKITARIGVTVKTFANWLTGDHQPVGKSLEKLRVSLDAEARRSAGRWDQTDRAGAGKAVGTRAP